MTDTSTWVPDETDTTRPSAARVYDYLLGGGHNFAADRAAAARIEQVLPNARRVARSNRAFLRRAVRYMAGQGVTRFLDLGSGIPTVGNVHEIAHGANPESRVVYVDFESVAVAHSRLLLDGDPRTSVVEADLIDPDTVLAHPDVRALLNTDEPVGLLMVAVFHFVPDHRDPAGLVGRYLSALPSGSLAAISHLTADHDAESMAQVAETMANSPNPMFFRPFDRVTPLFAELDLVEPGLVDADLWHPEEGVIDPDAPARGVYAGVGKVRH